MSRKAQKTQAEILETQKKRRSCKRRFFDGNLLCSEKKVTWLLRLLSEAEQALPWFQRQPWMPFRDLI